MKKARIQTISFFLLLAVLFILVVRVFLPYMSVILWAAVLYIILSPTHKKIIGRMNPAKKFYETRRRLLAGVYSVGTVLVMSALLFFIAFQLIGQGKILIEGAGSFIGAHSDFLTTTQAGRAFVSAIRDLSLGTVDISKIDIRRELLSLLGAYSSGIMAFSSTLLSNIGKFFISIVFICFALYFFYLDADYLSGLFIKAIPIEPENTRRLLTKFREVTKNLVKGFFLVAFLQSLIAFILFTVFGIRGSVLFAVLTFFCSFIPMFGCAIVWFPLGLGVIFGAGAVKGAVFMLLCAVFISFLDNFLKPFFLNNLVKIHPLLIFFSILGGLQLFGFNGLLLGPMTIILFFTVVDIILEQEISAETENTRQ